MKTKTTNKDLSDFGRREMSYLSTKPVENVAWMRVVSAKVDLESVSRMTGTPSVDDIESLYKEFLERIEALTNGKD